MSISNTETNSSCAVAGAAFPRLLALIGSLLLVPVTNAAQSAPPWGNACGDGRVDAVLDNFDSPWVFCCTAHASIPAPAVHIVPGCNGNAMAVDYDLTNVAPPGSSNQGQSWIVLQKSLAAPTDLSQYTHVRLAIRGSNLNSHDSIEVKIRDTHGLFVVPLQSMTDLPVWRAIYLDLREFAGTGTLDLANVVGLEIAIVRCAGCEVSDSSLNAPPEEHSGTLYLDEFALVNLKPGAANRVTESAFEAVPPSPAVRASAAAALRGQIIRSGAGTGFIPAWFPEKTPNINTYAQAEALLVFVYEFERTGDIAFRDLARGLATGLLSLQIPPGKAQAGAWYSSYTIQNGALGHPNRAIPNDPATLCDGNETMLPDPGLSANIDACEWVGNVGWALVALARLQRSGIYDQPAALETALDRGAAWVSGQSQYRGMDAHGYPNLISLGVEGNISAYFGLLAASRADAAALLGSAIFQFAWDPIQRRLKPGVGPADAETAIDVAGSWGVTFLRSIGRVQEALDSQSYAASVMRVSSFNGSTAGYGDIAGPYTPAIEFTAQAAAAGIKDAGFVMQQMSSLQIQVGGAYPGAFPGAADHWYGGPFSPWDTTMAGVSPTAWMYFALNRDPLIEVSLPVLSISKSHTGSFTQGQQNAPYTVTVQNSGTAAPTSGTVTVTEAVPSGLRLVSMSGAMWSCVGNTCTRGDTLNAGSSFPPITVTVNIDANAPSQVTNQVSVSSEGAATANASDVTTIGPAPPAAPVLASPKDGVSGVVVAPALAWNASSGATSYDVYFGASSPLFVANTTATMYVPGVLNSGATYYWQIVARGAAGSASSAVWSFTTGIPGTGLRFVPVTPCRAVDTRGANAPTLTGDLTRSFSIPQSGCGVPPTAKAYSLNVTVVPKGYLGYLSLWPAGQPQPGVSTLNSWQGVVVANAALVPAGTDGAVSVYVSNPTDVILDINGYFDSSSGPGSYAFYSATPCRVADTRGGTGQFNGPPLAGGQSRDFPIPLGPCNIPPTARAYAMNFTVVPDGYLGYLSAWPTGVAQPNVSTLNSWAGKVVANAAIVPGGTNESISVYASQQTNLILDVNGYFGLPAGAGALSFYPVAPCRVADTREHTGTFGGPEMQAATTRSFPIAASGCNIPSTAAEYSLNVTVVPDAYLGYLSVWPAGSARPGVSTLNSWDGTVVANAAIVPAGADTAVSVYVTNPTQVIIDINGYFAP